MNVIADEIKLKQDALAYRVCEKITLVSTKN